MMTRDAAIIDDNFVRKMSPNMDRRMEQTHRLPACGAVKRQPGGWQRRIRLIARLFAGDIFIELPDLVWRNRDGLIHSGHTRRRSRLLVKDIGGDAHLPSEYVRVFVETDDRIALQPILAVARHLNELTGKFLRKFGVAAEDRVVFLTQVDVIQRWRLTPIWTATH